MRNKNELALMEYKAVPTEFKAMDQGEYEGHFAVFNNLDDGDDISHPGMFTKTLQERRNRIKVFMAHDWSKLIGPPPKHIEEDNKGLFAAGRLTLDSFWGGEAFALMRDKALTEGSFGYKATRMDFENIDDVNVRHLREVMLLEISPVPLGMNPLTNVEAVKAALLAGLPLQPEGHYDALDLWAGLITDMAGKIKSRESLITADPQKARAAAQAMSDLAESLLEKIAAESPPIPGHHSPLSLRAKAAGQRLRMATTN